MNGTLMCRAASRGVTLVEFMAAFAIFAVVMLVGYAGWQISWMGVRDERNATLAYETAFGVLHAIQEQVQRANSIQVPDPDNSGVQSIQLRMSPKGASIRRAYRLRGGDLIMEWKDEGKPARTVFNDLSSLTFTVLDPPNNTLVRIVCSCTVGGRTVQLQTVAWRRN